MDNQDKIDLNEIFSKKGPEEKAPAQEEEEVDRTIGGSTDDIPDGKLFIEPEPEPEEKPEVPAKRTVPEDPNDLSWITKAKEAKNPKGRTSK